MPHKNGSKQGLDNESIGLSAIGSAGAWEFALDETNSEPPRWFAQIDGPSIYLSFEVESPCVIDTMLYFLTAGAQASNRSHEQSSPSNGELSIGKSEQDPVVLIRDDEFTDRYFLVAGKSTKLLVRVTLSGDDLKLLQSALRQAKEDLDEN